ncbi:MAG: anaerobic ribonucleoside-triphosphate reductase activating protein [Candidatus Staskawiczbacteria bacterium RIFOXYB2_FULL_32_9]|uniref:Anaerobic ribonucleoside-triphosphate reductase activating protein n=1 Tax=Candidatus Staskawiczbacteria bacterium RIFOXYD1_FULL_32_13 TaxID=1802234 RepID=A0A1G2JK94_9BACT|nr:MAG: Anaerobic ribonucleoside-triphosphate reductase activating protein [Parcubacteria group bacterium GW2011_GWC2_32_10]OGZ77971.1 MAG: anaerobic ribonucleoside-triphosphate reductase activating protein [Candidatus Staskawiczbacteria bacterium RIFOXYB1_FULL_32_11]OGZ78517.1 MAG: anaerobic ribonucleoside-triphosphate reductase activating protein [Candidatus Staskawiczbacteria bacterium RIFOXYA2_FULL_32_7]OGZ81103.1 MAG: anaerobic ribonucleoside-triphosphate reductase activating protein [Candi
MIIGGLQKTTLIDFPGKIACIVFLAGCNFRCPWCYSAELVLSEKIAKQPRLSEKEFFEFLEARKGLLDGVVLCGGEPSINKDLPDFIKKIKKMDFAVKLDTNGSNPKMLKELIDVKLIDYVAMDIKTSLKSQITNHKSQKKSVYESLLVDGVKMADIEKSVEILKTHSAGSGQAGNFDFEFRTTVVNSVHSKEDFLEIAKWIGGENVKYYLQNFRAEKTIDPEFEKVKPYSDLWLQDIAKEISQYFKECKAR